MGTHTTSTSKSTSLSRSRRRPQKTSHTRKNKLKPNDPLPPGVTTKELSCASCRIRKTRCTGDRPACVQCTKAAVAKGFPADGVHCVYSAASVFATQDDVAFEQRVGGRGARCIWDSSTSSSAITVVVSQSMTAPATGPATSPGAGPVVVQPVGEDNAGGPAPPAPGPSTSDIVVSEPEAELFETALAVQAYEPPSQSHAVSPLRSSMPDLPDLSNLTSLEHFFSAFTAVPTGLSTPTGLSFILPPSPPPPPLPPVVPPFLPPLLVPPVSPAPPLAASPPSSISSISLLGNLAPPFVPTTPAPTRNPWGVRSPSPLSPSTPEEPLPSSADVAFWEWGPLSLGEVDAWPGLSYVVTQSGIPH